MQPVQTHETMNMPRQRVMMLQAPTPGGGTDGLSRLVWDISIEKMLVKWCDEAKCFEWMHTETFTYYDVRARYIAISSAVLSAVSGFINVIVGNQTTESGFQLAWLFGGASILTSIVGILQDKLAYSRLASEHKQWAVQWTIIRQKIEEELSLAPEFRRDCGSFLKYLRQDIHQVTVEGNQQLPHYIRDACFAKFSAIPHFHLPDICGGIAHTRIFGLTESPDPVVNEPEPVTAV